MPAPHDPTRRDVPHDDPRRHGRRLSAPKALLIAVLVIGIPILEIWLLLALGHHIGALPTLLLLVVEAGVGVWLLRREGRRARRALADAVRSGHMPVNEATDAALVLVGGVLLILPGLVTDLLGLVFLLPFTRPLARRLVQALIGRRVDLSGVQQARVMRSRLNLDGQTVEGEVVDPAPGASAWNPQGPSRPAITGEVVTGEVID